MPARKRNLIDSTTRRLSRPDRRKPGLCVVGPGPARSLRQAHRLLRRALAGRDDSARVRAASPGRARTRWSGCSTRAAPNRCETGGTRSSTDVDSAAAIDVAAISGWRRYAHVAVRRLLRNFPGASLGADIVFASDLPSASGMSSSSALVVGTVNALAEIGGLHERPEWRENVRSAADAAGYFACFENGLAFGTLAGDSGVGTHGGSEDHVAIVCGAPRAAQRLAIRADSTRGRGEAARCVDVRDRVERRGGAEDRTRDGEVQQRGATRELLLELVEPSGDAAAVARRRTDVGDGGADRLRDLMRERRRSGRRSPGAARPVRARGRSRPRGARRGSCGRCRAPRELSAASQADAESMLGNQVPETIALARSRARPRRLRRVGIRRGLRRQRLGAGRARPGRRIRRAVASGVSRVVSRERRRRRLSSRRPVPHFRDWSSLRQLPRLCAPRIDARYGEASPELVDVNRPTSGGGQPPTPNSQRRAARTRGAKVDTACLIASASTQMVRSDSLGSWELEVGS